MTLPYLTDSESGHRTRRKNRKSNKKTSSLSRRDFCFASANETHIQQLFLFRRCNVFGTVWRVVFALKKGGGSMTAYEIASLLVAVLTLIATLKKKQPVSSWNLKAGFVTSSDQGRTARRCLFLLYHSEDHFAIYFFASAQAPPHSRRGIVHERNIAILLHEFVLD